MPTIKAIVSDVDGTLTNYGRRLSIESLVALRQVEARGVPVLLATGNVAPVTRAASAFIGVSGPSICENGGVLHWQVNGRARTEVLANRERCDEAYEALVASGVAAEKLSSDPWRLSEVALDLRTVDAEAVRRFVARFDPRGLKVVATEFAVHIMRAAVSKFSALPRALAWLAEEGGPRVTPAEVLAIGDSMNDLELFEGVGASAAVGNARAELKARAGYVAGKEFGAGVEEILRHHRLL